MTILSRMRGSALEACLKDLVVAARANRSAHVPLQFYFRQSDNVAGAMIENADILKDMFALARKMKVVIERAGFELRYAQSTYHHIGEGPQTRSKRKLSVDLTLRKNGNTFWIEVKYTDAQTWAAARKSGEVSLRHYRSAAKDSANWALDATVGGWRMHAPNAFGVFAVNAIVYGLYIDNCET